MDTYLILLTAFVLYLLYLMTAYGMKRKEPVLYSVLSGGVTGACFMLLIFQIAVWSPW